MQVKQQMDGQDPDVAAQATQELRSAAITAVKRPPSAKYIETEVGGLR
jgi:hypothetical protein